MVRLRRHFGAMQFAGGDTAAEPPKAVLQRTQRQGVPVYISTIGECLCAFAPQKNYSAAIGKRRNGIMKVTGLVVENDEVTRVNVYRDTQLRSDEWANRDCGWE